MGAERGTAARRRADAITAGMGAFADHGLTTMAIQRIANEIGVSQPYVFRLFGTKQAVFQACLGELEIRIRRMFRQAVATSPDDPLHAMGAAFREFVADGTMSGLWLQACAVARGDESVAARCRALISGVLEEAERLTAATPDDLTRFLANGALVTVLQAVGADLTGGSQAAVNSLRAAAATA